MRTALAALLIVPTLLAAGPFTTAARAAGGDQTKVTAPVPLLELVAPGGSGRLYTLNQGEATAAVQQYGFTLQPARVGYVRQQQFGGSQPIYRFRQNGTSRYVLVTSPSERDSLAGSGSFTLEGIIGYLAAVQQPGTVQLDRYDNGREWRVALATDDAAVRAQGYQLDGPLGWVYPYYVRAGALYFGTYDPDTNPVVLRQCQQVYGPTSTIPRAGDYWCGVRDYAGYDAPTVPRNTWGWTDDFSYLKPSIGYYDDSRTQTAREQIAQAAGAGLGFFAFYWYWGAAQHRELYADGLHSFLAAANRNLMDFSLTICAEVYGSDRSLGIPVADFDAATTYLVDTYLSQGDYLRANDGREIVQLCDTRGIGAGTPQDVASFVGMLRSKARSRLGESLLVLAHRDLGLNLQQVGADGTYCGALLQNPGSGPSSYQWYVDNLRSIYGAVPGTFMRCLTSDFNEKPRYPFLIGDRSQIRYETGQSVGLFEQSATEAYRDIASSNVRRLPLVDNFVLVYSWNEWLEGGVPLEPNVRDGCAYLDALQAGLQLTSSSSCTPTPAA